MVYKNAVGIAQNLHWFFDETEKSFLDQMVEAGLETVQIIATAESLQYMTAANAEKLLKMTDGKIRITSFWCGWRCPNVWNFTKGPQTLGLVPIKYRKERLEDLKNGAEFARALGVFDMATHVGFVPEQPCDPNYQGVVDAVKEIADYCGERNLHFNFETGQETPVTLMRLFSDVGADNLGVNLDPANLILYGRGNPIDALDIYGDKIRGVHVKDGDYPKGDFHKLGNERVVGEGSVNFPVFLPKLLKNGYKGDLYIEREITGAERANDVKKTIDYLRNIIKNVE